MAEIIKLAIGVPAYGGKVASEHSRMWLELGSTLSLSHERFQLVMMATVDIQPVDRARNFLLAHAMTKDADWLLMVDADTWVEADPTVDSVDAGFLILRMIADADRADAAMISAPVTLRTSGLHGPSDLPVAVYRAAAQTENKPSGCEPTSVSSTLTRGPLGQAHAVGAACLAINLRKIGEAHFQFTPIMSEDLDFCRQIRELGGKILVDSRVRTGHTSRSFALYNR